MPRSIFNQASTAVSGSQSSMPTLRKLYANKTLKSYLDIISLTSHDITRLKVAIVNGARPDLLVDFDIHHAAGPSLLEECRRLNGCATGEAKMTKGHRLPAKHVIHTVGPIYDAAHAENRAGLLAACYRRSLRLAANHKLKTIALPLISTGQNGYPLEDAIRVALDTTRRFLSSSDGDKIELIVFVTKTEDEKRAYRRLIPEYFPCSV